MQAGAIEIAIEAQDKHEIEKDVRRFAPELNGQRGFGC